MITAWQFRDKDPLSTEARRDWLLNYCSDLRSAMISRYQEGQVEHNGDLGQVSTFDLMTELLREIIDAMMYHGELMRRHIEQTGDVDSVPPGSVGKTVSVVQSTSVRVAVPDALLREIHAGDIVISQDLLRKLMAVVYREIGDKNLVAFERAVIDQVAQACGYTNSHSNFHDEEQTQGSFNRTV